MKYTIKCLSYNSYYNYSRNIHDENTIYPHSWIHTKNAIIGEKLSLNRNHLRHLRKINPSRIKDFIIIPLL